MSPVSMHQVQLAVNLEPWAGLNKTTFIELVEHLVRTDVSNSHPEVTRRRIVQPMSQGWHPVSRDTVMSLIEGLMSSYPSEKRYPEPELRMRKPHNPVYCAPVAHVNPAPAHIAPAPQRKRKLANVNRPSMEPPCRRKSDSSTPAYVESPFSLPVTCPARNRRSSAPVTRPDANGGWVAVSRKDVHTLIESNFTLDSTPEEDTPPVGRESDDDDDTPLREANDTPPPREEQNSRPRKWKSRLMERVLLTQTANPI